jgi:uncharacterized protein (TIGR03067 family)
VNGGERVEVMRARILLIVTSVALLGFAPAPLPKQQRQREGPADVTGKWEVVLWVEDGLRIDDLEDFRVEMTKDSFVLVVLGRLDAYYRYRLRLEPTASPPAFTWSFRDQTEFVGSYRLCGEEMTLILDRGDRLEARPIDFDGKAGRRFVLHRIRR